MWRMMRVGQASSDITRVLFKYICAVYIILYNKNEMGLSCTVGHIRLPRPFQKNGGTMLAGQVTIPTGYSTASLQPSWCSFCPPRKDDRLSTHLVLCWCNWGLHSRPSSVSHHEAHHNFFKLLLYKIKNIAF